MDVKKLVFASELLAFVVCQGMGVDNGHGHGHAPPMHHQEIPSGRGSIFDLGHTIRETSREGDPHAALDVFNSYCNSKMMKGTYSF